MPSLSKYWRVNTEEWIPFFPPKLTEKAEIYPVLLYIEQVLDSEYLSVPPKLTEKAEIPSFNVLLFNFWAVYQFLCLMKYFIGYVDRLSTYLQKFQGDSGPATLCKYSVRATSSPSEQTRRPYGESSSRAPSTAARLTSVGDPPHSERR